MTLVEKSFTIDAAHSLSGYPGDCARLHGHSWRITVLIEGVCNSDGMVLDFRDLSRVVNAQLEQLDHRYLNDEVTFRPTAENLAGFLCGKLAVPLSSLPNLRRIGVRVQEGDGGAATFWRDLR